MRAPQRSPSPVSPAIEFRRDPDSRGRPCNRVRSSHTPHWRNTAHRLPSTELPLSDLQDSAPSRKAYPPADRGEVDETKPQKSIVTGALHFHRTELRPHRNS